MANIYKSKFTGQEIDEILTNASNVTNIEANPSGEATEELTKLTIGDVTYNLGGGVPVEANPSGDGTAELTKIKIGDTVYSIPQGSGGGDTNFYENILIIQNGGSGALNSVSANDYITKVLTRKDSDNTAEKIITNNALVGASSSVYMLTIWYGAIKYTSITEWLSTSTTPSKYDIGGISITGATSGRSYGLKETATEPLIIVIAVIPSSGSN